MASAPRGSGIGRERRAVGAKTANGDEHGAARDRARVVGHSRDHSRVPPRILNAAARVRRERSGRGDERVERHRGPRGSTAETVR